VLNVQRGSPAADTVVFPSAEAARAGQREPVHAALVSYLDFIVSINGDVLEPESPWFVDELQHNMGKPVILEVYNYKSETWRTVQVVPRAGWGGEGLLGLHVRWDSIERAAEAALHVVGVAAGSPAAAAGLLPGDDFILGAPEGVFDGIDVFGDYLAVHAGTEALLYVLRASTGASREEEKEEEGEKWRPMGAAAIAV
jgi:hypothetical protein